ncbi:MAG TPA: DUF1385 domain-containing protein [Mobilitalea sp.]|nr:DUF1385 domain-containing protein [Mobilitalea sp.]
MKPSGIGGMAVIEGVMMRNKGDYAVAVRKPNNEITVEKFKYKDFSEKVKLFKLPIFRGILAFIDSMVIGIKVINYSASFFEEEEQPKKGKKEQTEKNDSVMTALLTALAVIVSLASSILIFMVLPVLISNLFVRMIKGTFLLYLLEGVLRLLIFIGYILAASQMKEIKRVFMYHGAEHKVINCLENGFELTVENVKWQTKAHKRCGTSFMFLVMFVSLVFFVIIRPQTLLWRILSRIMLVPAIAGVSYEFIRLAGKSDNKLVNILSKPGLWLQALTTKEPDEDMIEVAIKSVEAVFDWKAFLEEETVNDKELGKTGKKSVSNRKSGRANVSNEYSVSRGRNVRGARKGTSVTSKDAAKKEYAAAAEITIASPKTAAYDEEDDDEILRALDKYLDFNDED